MAVRFLGFAVICLVILNWRLINRITKLEKNLKASVDYTDRTLELYKVLKDEIWLMKHQTPKR